ncbi:hypothetical protein ACP70R_031170 [Stipagrostis hirtigluma subsp. patula]
MAADFLYEAKVWWLRFNNGVAVDDADDDGEEQDEEEAVEGAAGETAGGMGVSGGNLTPRVAAGRGEAGTETAPGDRGRADTEATASDVKAEIVARGGGTAAVEGEAEGARGVKRSSPRLRDRVADGEEISGGNSVQLHGDLPHRKRKAIAECHKLHGDGVEVQNDMDQAQCLREVAEGAKRVHKENDNLRLQLSLKMKELEHEENRRLSELILKTKEIEYLQKQNEELKAENENLRKTAQKVLQVLSDI